MEVSFWTIFGVMWAAFWAMCSLIILVPLCLEMRDFWKEGERNLFAYFNTFMITLVLAPFFIGFKFYEIEKYNNP